MRQIVGSIPTRENELFNIFALVSGQSAIQHAMPSEFDGKWGMESLKTGFTQLCAGYIMNLKKKYFLCIRFFFIIGSRTQLHNIASYFIALSSPLHLVFI